jgi:hypothetical protein
MPKPRIDKERAEAIAAELKRYDLMKGGKALVERKAKISEAVWYRALAGAQIEKANARKIENFLKSAKEVA